MYGFIGSPPVYVKCELWVNDVTRVKTLPELAMGLHGSSTESEEGEAVDTWRALTSGSK